MGTADDPNRAIDREPEASNPEKPIEPSSTTQRPIEPATANELDSDLEADKTDMSAVGDDGQVFGG